MRYEIKAECGRTLAEAILASVAEQDMRSLLVGLREWLARGVSEALAACDHKHTSKLAFASRDDNDNHNGHHCTLMEQIVEACDGDLFTAAQVEQREDEAREQEHSDAYDEGHEAGVESERESHECCHDECVSQYDMDQKVEEARNEVLAELCDEPTRTVLEAQEEAERIKKEASDKARRYMNESERSMTYDDGFYDGFEDALREPARLAREHAARASEGRPVDPDTVLRFSLLELD